MLASGSVARPRLRAEPHHPWHRHHGADQRRPRGRRYQSHVPVRPRRVGKPRLLPGALPQLHHRPSPGGPAPIDWLGGGDHHRTADHARLAGGRSGPVGGDERRSGGPAVCRPAADLRAGRGLGAELPGRPGPLRLRLLGRGGPNVRRVHRVHRTEHRGRGDAVHRRRARLAAGAPGVGPRLRHRGRAGGAASTASAPWGCRRSSRSPWRGTCARRR